MGYRGEVIAKMRSTTDVVPAIYKPGERFAQLVIVAIPEITITEASELTETDRGDGGFGSTDTADTNVDVAVDNKAEVTDTNA